MISGMTTGNGCKPRRYGVKRTRIWNNSFFSNRVPFHSFWMPFCVESVSPRRAVHFSGLDAKFRRESASEDNFCPIGVQCATRAGNLRQIAPIVRQSLARCFGRNFGPNFDRRDFRENLRSVSLEVVGCFLCILLYRFLQRRASIEFSVRIIFVSLRKFFLQNQFEPRSYAVLLLWC